MSTWHHDHPDRGPDDVTVRGLDRLAERTGRSRDWLVAQAVQEYLAVQAWQLDKITAGIEAADRGEFADQAEIDCIVRKYDRPS
jgi:predicted transcriptional regulator